MAVKNTRKKNAAQTCVWAAFEVGWPSEGFNDSNHHLFVGSSIRDVGVESRWQSQEELSLRLSPFLFWPSYLCRRSSAYRPSLLSLKQIAFASVLTVSVAVMEDLTVSINSILLLLKSMTFC